MRRGAGAALVLAMAVIPVGADVITGAGWSVHFNLPDQNSSSPSPGEFEIRDALLARINQLQTNDQAWLATYTFSGDTTNNGAAGPIMLAISNALNRGARVAFILDNLEVSVTSVWQGISLQMLTNRTVNPLVVAQDVLNVTNGIMHNKLGVFRIGTNFISFTTSANFTGGAGTLQWNIALQVQDRALFNAYTNEMNEFLSGRFHTNALKSHAHSGSNFFISGSWGTNYVRFAPYASSAAGGDNAQADIVRFISNATTEIVFALNKLTRPLIRDALKQAANRGVIITGVIPQSDLLVSPFTNSRQVYTNLIDAAAYAGSNRVNFLLPFSSAAGAAYDNGGDDLVHAKYMIIDPWTDQGVVVHGSANWTDSALASTSANDENVLFIRHSGIARAFYAQFRRMTATLPGEEYDWHVVMRPAGLPEIAYWRTSTNGMVMEQAIPSVPLSWIVIQTNGMLGRMIMPLDGVVHFFRTYH